MSASCRTTRGSDAHRPLLRTRLLLLAAVILTLTLTSTPTAEAYTSRYVYYYQATEGNPYTVCDSQYSGFPPNLYEASRQNRVSEVLRQHLQQSNVYISIAGTTLQSPCTRDSNCVWCWIGGPLKDSPVAFYIGRSSTSTQAANSNYYYNWDNEYPSWSSSTAVTELYSTTSSWRNTGKSTSTSYFICEILGAGNDDTTTAAPTPRPTPAPSTAAPAAAGAGSSQSRVPWWAYLIIGIGCFIIIVTFIVVICCKICKQKEESEEAQEQRDPSVSPESGANGSNSNQEERNDGGERVRMNGLLMPDTYPMELSGEMPEDLKEVNEQPRYFSQAAPGIAMEPQMGHANYGASNLENSTASLHLPNGFLSTEPQHSGSFTTLPVIPPPPSSPATDQQQNAEPPTSRSASRRVSFVGLRDSDGQYNQKCMTLADSYPQMYYPNPNLNGYPMNTQQQEFVQPGNAYNTQYAFPAQDEGSAYEVGSQLAPPSFYQPATYLADSYDAPQVPSYTEQPPAKYASLPTATYSSQPTATYSSLPTATYSSKTSVNSTPPRKHSAPNVSVGSQRQLSTHPAQAAMERANSTAELRRSLSRHGSFKNRQKNDVNPSGVESDFIGTEPQASGLARRGSLPQ